ncbi:YcaO-like family protein [Wukongibacter baidiensis]|uniref:YcaO-like family protein n=1 Tax=Wukongibacter baidiensis TaxID=1723361 RepID=UPI003D7FF41A
MNSLSQRKYKDELPLNTINRIRNIFTDLGILTVETNWQNSAKDFYSVTLSVENTSIKSNGKGTTNEYALASAYAELLERIQNQSHFRLSMDFSKENFEYMGFFYAPDEKCLTTSELLNSDEDWINTQLERIEPTIDIKELLDKWTYISYEHIPCDFISLPYLNISNNKLSHIPIKMVSKMYMSNGMCAGNTPQEALVQGISEIIERHVNKEIILNKITPPTIPREYIKKYPRIESMINSIESSGNYSVILKDCSLNEGYPVIGVIFINRDDQSYFIKFGSHPIFEIAAERTLTELLQGQNVRSMMGVKEFSYKTAIDDEHDNLINILVNGSGIYPMELFSHEFSYEFKEFETVHELNNVEMFKYMVNFIENKGFSIFVRDVSYLNFPSYHVIIPGLSEIEKFDDIRALERYSRYNTVKRHIRNLEKLSTESINEIFSFFEEEKYNRFSSISQFLNFKTKAIFPWYYSNIDLFIGSLHYHLGNLYEAFNIFDRFISYLKLGNYKNKIEITYYKCIRDYIGARVDGLSQSDAIEILKLFYPVNIISGMLGDIGNPEAIFNRYGQLQCWNCDECKLKAHCFTQITEGIYKTLKERYAANPIDQRALKKLLDL